MNNQAYWITPKGDVLKPASFHIVMVVKNPKKFGETTKTLQATFDNHGEPMRSNVEGKAREEVMMRVIQRGFIRIRNIETGRDQRWSIQLNKLTNHTNDILWAWSNTMINKNIAKDKYADVVIHQLGNNKMTRTSLDKIASGEQIRESLLRGMVFLNENQIDQIPDYEDYAGLLTERQIEHMSTVDRITSILLRV